MRRYPERPLVGVGAVIIKEGKILLVKRANEPNKGRWSVPGGLVRKGESLVDALKREIREELNVDIDVGDVACVTDEIFYDDKGGVAYHYVVIDFFAEIRGNPKPGSDAADVKWVSLKEIDKIDVVEFVKMLVEKITRKEGGIYLRKTD